MRVKRVIQNLAEKKFYSLDVASAAMPVTWTFRSFLGSIQQGTTASTRIGNKIRVHRITWSFLLTPSAVAGVADGCTGRIVVIHNKETNATVPTGSGDVFEGNQVYAQRFVPLMSRVSILKDVQHSMVTTGVNAGTPASAGPQACFAITIYPNKVIEYQNNTASVVALFKDDYQLGMTCTDASTCFCEYSIQVVFTDV